MRDRPNGADLVAIARDVLVNAVMPMAPEQERVTALMIASALGIAERELAAGEAPLRAELAALTAIYGVPQAAADAQALHDALLRLNRRLAEDLRQDTIVDAERRSAVYRLLVESTRARVAESNPKYLENG
jgi:hypothetical protein